MTDVRAPWVAYTALGIAAVLFLASFLGDGTGLFGWGFMRAPAWAYVLLLLSVVLGVAYVRR